MSNTFGDHFPPKLAIRILSICQNRRLSLFKLLTNEQRHVA